MGSLVYLWLIYGFFMVYLWIDWLEVVAPSVLAPCIALSFSNGGQQQRDNQKRRAAGLVHARQRVD